MMMFILIIQGLQYYFVVDGVITFFSFSASIDYSLFLILFFLFIGEIFVNEVKFLLEDERRFITMHKLKVN